MWECNDVVVLCFCIVYYVLMLLVVDYFFWWFGFGVVIVVEGVGWYVEVELCLVCCDMCLEIVEDGFWCIVWIVVGFDY